jgi:hypothetical protein
MDKSVRIQEKIIKENFTMEVRLSVESNPLHTANIYFIKDTTPRFLRVFGVYESENTRQNVNH